MKVGFMGSGAIAEILSRNMTTQGVVKAEDVFLFDVSKERLAFMHEKYGLSVCNS